MEAMKFKDIVQGIMDYNGWTQIEFADHYKIIPSQVYRWLKGQNPKLDVYIKFYNIYQDLKKVTVQGEIPCLI